MKIITVCENGNIRSVALAYILKTVFNHEVIAIGAKRTKLRTQQMLFDWADKVIVFDTAIPWALKHKGRIIFNIGEDKWHDANAQELVHKLYKELSKHPELFIDNSSK